MKPRIKMHQMPGDVSRRTKIAMLERRHPDATRSKSFRKMIRMRERAVLRRIGKALINEGTPPSSPPFRDGT